MSGPRSNGRPVVVGVADHGGWAILVSAATVDGKPTVVDRRRVALIEKGVPTQPYHHDTLAMPDAAAEQLLRRVKRSIAVCTAQAFENLSKDLAPRYRVSSITIRQPTLERLPATVRDAHQSYHVQCRADGMLYHSAICDAARQHGWKLEFLQRGDELAQAAQALKMTTEDVERFLSDLKQTLKSPWTAEYRLAFAAAIGHLGPGSRVR